jgi:hypothetical protein
MIDLKKLFKKEHPLLTEPASWIAAGHGMSGDPLDRIPIQGRIWISHENGKIVNTGEMSVVSRSNPMTFNTSYELTPTQDELVLDFFQANDPVGNMVGKVVAFDDRLVSTYTSGDGSLTGFEVLHRLGDNRYAVTGTLTREGQILNLWKLDLVRPAEEGEDLEKEASGTD